MVARGSKFIWGFAILACSVFVLVRFLLFQIGKTCIYLKWEVVKSFSGLKVLRLHVRLFEVKL